MKEICRYAQFAWETHQQPGTGADSGSESDSLAFEGEGTPHSNAGTNLRSKRRHRRFSLAEDQNEGGGAWHQPPDQPPHRPQNVSQNKRRRQPRKESAGQEMEDMFSRILEKLESRLSNPADVTAASDLSDD